MVTLSEQSKKALDALANERQTSVSKTAAELIDLALDIHEDEVLDALANERARDTKTLTGDQVWK